MDTMSEISPIRLLAFAAYSEYLYFSTSAALISAVPILDKGSVDASLSLKKQTNKNKI